MSRMLMSYASRFCVKLEYCARLNVALYVAPLVTLVAVTVTVASVPLPQGR